MSIKARYQLELLFTDGCIDIQYQYKRYKELLTEIDMDWKKNLIDDIDWLKIRNEIVNNLRLIKHKLQYERE